MSSLSEIYEINKTICNETSNKYKLFDKEIDLFNEERYKSGCNSFYKSKYIMDHIINNKLIIDIYIDNNRIFLNNEAFLYLFHDSDIKNFLLIKKCSGVFGHLYTSEKWINIFDNGKIIKIIEFFKINFYEDEVNIHNPNYKDIIELKIIKDLNVIYDENNIQKQLNIQKEYYENKLNELKNQINYLQENISFIKNNATVNYDYNDISKRIKPFKRELMSVSKWRKTSFENIPMATMIYPTKFI